MTQGPGGHGKEESYSEQGGKCLEGVEQGVTWSDLCSKKQP